MPEISRFLGISIRMYRDEHLPPHFHAIYNEFAAQISIRHPAIINGKLPPRVLGYVIEWASLHENELAQCWDAARSDQVIGKIEPLI
ncbi:MAG TPA: DUF4160 domain-containing protein [Verrucomicrobiae bacterium]|jgi:hypothetical protein|nr:DUF4160 domain-containing protein [Verrucomicrobiae bacterium]